MNPYRGVNPLGKRPVHPALLALAILADAGYIVKRSDGTFAARTLQEGTGIDITNPTGEAGDPVISVDLSELSIDHGSLVGLGDDDHPQYLTHAEGDAAYAAIIHIHDDRYYTEAELNAGQLDTRYYTEAEADALFLTQAEADALYSALAHNHDHGTLTGLGDNDHPQYLLVADIDDVPVNGVVNAPISSNWAFDHLAAADPHPGYRLESADHNHQSTGLQGGQLDHGLALVGLGDDDHTQYHTDGRALTWLGTRSTADLPEGANLYFTNERAQDAVGAILSDSATIDFTYDDVGNTISAIIIDDSVSNAKLANMAQATIKGRAAGSGLGDPTDLSAAQVAAIINSSLDHGALTGLGDNDHPQYLLITDIDDVPVNGVTNAPISSNWAFDHVAAADPHPGYLLESAYTAADVLEKLLTVDGAGSGLDADLLDGQSSAFYLARGNHTGTQTAATISDFNEAAQDAVGTIFVDSAQIDFTYTDATPSITGTIINDSITNSHLANMAQATIKGRAAGAGAGDPTDLSAAQVVAIINSSIDHGSMSGLADDDHPQYGAIAQNETISGAWSFASLSVDGNLVLDMPSSSTERGPWNPIVTAIRGSGRRLASFADEDFASGVNNVAVYNNAGNGAVTHTRDLHTNFEAGVVAPNSSGYSIKISYLNPPGAASPGFGGFVTIINSEENHTFVQIFQAKLPIGRSLNIAENSQGDNRTSYWLTNTAGTGKFEWYARVSHCGDGGSFSSGGHVYVTGGADSSFDWFLASVAVIDVTECPNFWTADNDGAASGLDADLLDGQHGSFYLARANHTGTQLLATISDVTMSVANLNSLDDGVNSTLHFHNSDRDRANHTGSQTSATISDFAESVDDRVAALLVAGTNITLTYNDGAGTLTVDAASSASDLDNIIDGTNEVIAENKSRVYASPLTITGGGSLLIPASSQVAFVG